MAALPGLVLLNLLKPKKLNVIEQVVAAFAASLVANYILVATLTALHLNSRPYWIVILAAEVGYLAFCLKAHPDFWRFDIRSLNKVKDISPLTAVSAILLFAAVLFMAERMKTNWGTVFVGNDDIASWDYWAMEWHAGQFPTLTSFYPQLIPANWSISYTLTGNTSVKMFAKATAPLYSLLTVLLFLSLSIRRHNPAYLLGGFIYVFLFVHYMGPTFLTYGYADQPLLFFGFLSIYILLCQDFPSRDAVLASLLTAVATLLAKQGGVFVLAVVLAYLIVWQVRRRGRQIDAQPDVELHRLFVFLIVLTAALCAGWYLSKFWQMRQGQDVSNLHLLTQGLHAGRSYPERLAATAKMLFFRRQGLSPYVVTPMILLLAGSLFVRAMRPVTAFIIIPFLILYGMFFSYEVRPALFVFPFVALVCGYVIFRLLSWLLEHLGKVNGRRWMLLAIELVFCISMWLLFFPGVAWLPARVGGLLRNDWIAETIHEFCPPVAVLSAVLLALTWVHFNRPRYVHAGRIALFTVLGAAVLGASLASSNDIVSQQLFEARRTIGDGCINDALYRMVGTGQIKSGIISDYWFLMAMPEINRFFLHTKCGAPCHIEGLRASAELYPDAGFVLMSDASFAPETLKRLSSSPEFTTVFSCAGKRLLEIHRGLPGSPLKVSSPPRAVATPAGRGA